MSARPRGVIGHDCGLLDCWGIVVLLCACGLLGCRAQADPKSEQAPRIEVDASAPAEPEVLGGGAAGGSADAVPPMPELYLSRSLRVSTVPATATLELDGKVIENPFRGAVSRDTAPHRLVARAPGYAEAEASFRLGRWPKEVVLKLRTLKEDAAWQRQKELNKTPEGREERARMVVESGRACVRALKHQPMRLSGDALVRRWGQLRRCLPPRGDWHVGVHDRVLPQPVAYYGPHWLPLESAYSCGCTRPTLCQLRLVVRLPREECEQKGLLPVVQGTGWGESFVGCRPPELPAGDVFPPEPAVRTLRPVPGGRMRRR